MYIMKKIIWTAIIFINMKTILLLPEAKILIKFFLSFFPKEIILIFAGNNINAN